MDSPPLHALRNVNGTLNGLFATSTTSTFPTSSTNARNYWVDVMFNPNTGPATAPGAPGQRHRHPWQRLRARHLDRCRRTAAA